MIEDNIPVSVLIVDDNPAKLTALTAELEDMGIGIITATSGMEALRKLLAQEFAVVLLDVNMPIMDGFETAALIRSRPRSEHLPIIFITAEVFTDDARLKGYEIGAVDYIISPVLPQILRAKVSAFADLHRLREQSFRYAEALLEKNEEIARQNLQLHDNALRLQTVLDTVVDGIITINERGLVETVNLAAERIFGYAAAEIIGQNIRILMPEPYYSAHNDYLEHYRTTGEARIIGIGREVMGRRKDGSTFPLELAVSEMWLGNERHFTGIVRDITARKQAEDQLNLFFALSLDMLCVAGADGYFKRVNPAFTQMLGWSIEEFLARPLLDFVHPDDHAATLCEVEKQIATGENILNFENRYLHKDGSWRVLSWASVPAGGLIFATARDITERKHIEEKLRAQSEEIAHANRMKSEFLATMSHEIRTPMNGVIGMIDVLHQSSLKAYQVEMVDLIRESAYSLLGIIDDILDFSKIEAGKLALESAPMPVADVVEKVCAMLDHLADKKGVELTLFTDPALPAEVLGDAGRLRQVLVNLANNAIKFSGGQDRAGRVSVRVVLADDCKAATTPGSLAAFPPSMEVRSGDSSPSAGEVGQRMEQPPRATHGAVAERNPEQACLELSRKVVVEIRITDNGIGMNEDTLSGLFTAFTQADASTTRRFGGTGLGLAIARHLLELMNGEITVQSVPGKGSTFTVRLPFVSLPAKTNGAESSVAGLSCLVVGDSQGLADDVAAYLAHGSAVVERVPDLAAARERDKSGAPGLWLLVLDAAGVSPPLDELRAIARTRPEQEIRFVVIVRGQRRKPRLAGTDVVLVDGNILTRGIVLKAVAIAAGRERALEEQETPLPGKTEAEFRPPSRAAALYQGRLILVAEDNETNQKVILRQLALLGFAADVVDDGHQALERWQSGDYALILTDLHMPVMDGYVLTAAIRAKEKSSRRIPIVALTANALKDEAEHCRSVGMDDYLSKPVQLVQLKAMLEKWLPAVAEPSPNPSDSPVMPVDVSVLKALVGDDPAVIREFLHDFRISATQTAVELKAACENGQTVQVGALAHKLKSSARSVGALALGELCADMEQAGKAGQVEALTALLSRFEAEMAAVDAYLDA